MNREELLKLKSGYKISSDVEDGETVGEAIGKLEAVINEEIKKTQQLPFGKKLRR